MQNIYIKTKLDVKIGESVAVLEDLTWISFSLSFIVTILFAKTVSHLIKTIDNV